MADIHEDIGYIKATLEAQAKNTEDLAVLVGELRDDMHGMRDQISAYKNLIVFAKALGWVGLLTLTLKFGDIPDKMRELWL